MLRRLLVYVVAAIVVCEIESLLPETVSSVAMAARLMFASIRLACEDESVIVFV